MPYLLFTPYHIYNQSQLAERKHVARYWSTNTTAMAVPLSAHPSPLVITTKLAAAILGGRLFGGVLLAQYCPVTTTRYQNASFTVRRYLNVSVDDRRLTVMKLCSSFTHVAEHSQNVRLTQSTERLPFNHLRHQPP